MNKEHKATLVAELAGLVEKWRTDGRKLFDDPDSEARNYRGDGMLRCADDLAAILAAQPGGADHGDV